MTVGLRVVLAALPAAVLGGGGRGDEAAEDGARLTPPGR